MSTGGIDAAGLIPHRPPMLFVDSVSLGPEGDKALATVRETWPVLDGAGLLSGAVFFEIMAQGFAAISAARAEREGICDRPKAGFLVGVKKFDCCGSAAPGDELCVTIGNSSSFGPFHVFDASIAGKDEKILATGQIKVFLVKDESMLKDGLEG